MFFSNGDILKAISEGYSVAVEALKGENIRVYGDLRLVTYAHFLLENYFPLHDELCMISGRYLEDYVHGNNDVKELIEKQKNKFLNLKLIFLDYKKSGGKMI